jgi:hypothetical protein
MVMKALKKREEKLGRLIEAKKKEIAEKAKKDAAKNK